LSASDGRLLEIPSTPTKSLDITRTGSTAMLHFSSPEVALSPPEARMLHGMTEIEQALLRRLLQQMVSNLS
jgi:hypothetical protein